MSQEQQEFVGPLFLRPGTTDSFVYHQVWDQQQYKPVIGLRDYKLIIDAGANIGMSALYFKKHHPNADIAGFEPDPENCEVFLKNMPGGDDDPILMDAAIGGVASKGRIHDRGFGACSLQVQADWSGDIEVWTMEQAIDLNSHKEKRPCLVKMDIEGAETECFRHPSWLNRVDVFAVELHTNEAALELLRALDSVDRKHRRWTLGETTFVVFE